VQQLVPGARLELRGAVRRGHDTAVAEWASVLADKTTLAGANVYRFGSDAKIVDVVGVT
jgi:hypothetical protein